MDRSIMPQTEGLPAFASNLISEATRQAEHEAIYHEAIELSGLLLRTVDMLHVGVVMVGPGRRLLFANRAAKQLLLRRDGIAVCNGRLHAATPAATQAFDRQLRVAIARPAQASKAGSAFTLPLSGGRCLTVLAMGCGRSPGGKPSAAILFVSDPGAEPDVDECYIARTYALTRAEARLLRALVSGRTLSEYAQAAHITLFTAKGYLKHIFEKTGTSRQADLVRLVLADPILRLIPDAVTPDEEVWARRPHAREGRVRSPSMSNLATRLHRRWPISHSGPSHPCAGNDRDLPLRSTASESLHDDGQSEVVT
jgi:DNA-binding CsgD family transcriptional regulator